MLPVCTSVLSRPRERTPNNFTPRDVQWCLLSTTDSSRPHILLEQKNVGSPLTKSVYAARGDVNSCGDWLALALKEAFRTEDGASIWWYLRLA
jgi:hypothetical protein